ncbi:MAG: pilus assembly protein [Frankiales bacterium]|jgi:Flp pilus assembly protein TadG|nr:pilus assembly protein [Frankiales bacterium]
MSRDDDGAAVVDFVLVSVLLLALFLLVFQVGVVLHVRNVLVASAAEGARFGANADRNPDDGAERAKTVIADALGQRVADSMSCVPVEGEELNGQPVVDIQCTGPMPIVFLPTGAFSLTVHGHAIEEGR